VKRINRRWAFVLATMLLASVTARASGDIAPDAVQQMQTLLGNVYKAGSPGAAVIVMKDGKSLLRKGYGLADLELGVPIGPDMVFRLGSMTKQFTAVATLMLVQEGKIALDDDIRKFLPDYPTHGEKITVENLLSHTSGIKNYTEIPSWLALWRKDFAVQELIDLFKNEPMQFKPGTKWEYSNSGYILLGAIIEKASGKSYADFIRQRIFEPLGMKHSYYGDYDTIIPGRVPGYEVHGDGFVNTAYLSMTQPYAAGSLLSSVDDLALWNEALYTDKLVPQALLKKAWTPFTLADGRSTGYGYGWVSWDYAGHRVVEHGGNINGFASDAVRLSDDHVYVAVLSNGAGLTPAPDELAQKLAAIAIGKPMREPVAIKVPAAILDGYAGVYRIDAQTTRLVRREGDHLMTRRSGGSWAEAWPLSPSEFFYKNQPDHIHFERDAKGKATAMVKDGHYGGGERAAKISSELPKEREAAKIDPAIYARYVGTYELAPTFRITIIREGGQLFAEPTGQPREEILPSSETDFFLRATDAQISFVRDAAGETSGLVLHQGGADLPGKKLK
jgi:CubicO group peptidase (beta-lactamase class C family)